MISKFFIERPVLANVIAILTVVLGGPGRFSLDARPRRKK